MNYAFINHGRNMKISKKQIEYLFLGMVTSDKRKNTIQKGNVFSK